jgi:hypothetical protein
MRVIESILMTDWLVIYPQNQALSSPGVLGQLLGKQSLSAGPDFSPWQRELRPAAGWLGVRGDPLFATFFVAN